MGRHNFWENLDIYMNIDLYESHRYARNSLLFSV